MPGQFFRYRHKFLTIYRNSSQHWLSAVVTHRKIILQSPLIQNEMPFGKASEFKPALANIANVANVSNIANQACLFINGNLADIMTTKTNSVGILVIFVTGEDLSDVTRQICEQLRERFNAWDIINNIENGR